jgi:predicted RNA-binding protein YlxR (DUF448 family)
MFCELHTPLKLRKCIENRHKKQEEDLTRFVKNNQKLNQIYGYEDMFVKYNKNKQTKEKDKEATFAKEGRQFLVVIISFSFFSNFKHFLNNRMKASKLLLRSIKTKKISISSIIS